MRKTVVGTTELVKELEATGEYPIEVAYRFEVRRLGLVTSALPIMSHNENEDGIAKVVKEVYQHEIGEPVEVEVFTRSRPRKVVAFVTTCHKIERYELEEVYWYAEEA